MPIQRVDAIPAIQRPAGQGRPAQVHPDGDDLLAAGPGAYLVETFEHDGTEESLKAARNKVQSATRQLKNVDVSIKTRAVSFSDAIQVFAIVMTDEEQNEYAAQLEARRARREAAQAESEDADESDEFDEDEG